MLTIEVGRNDVENIQSLLGPSHCWFVTLKRWRRQSSPCRLRSPSGRVLGVPSACRKERNHRLEASTGAGEAVARHRPELAAYTRPRRRNDRQPGREGGKAGGSPRDLTYGRWSLSLRVALSRHKRSISVSS